MIRESSELLLDVQDLHIAFRVGNEKRPAVNGVSFSVHRGEALALVGESGSGKTASALSVLRLLPASALVSSKSRISLFGKDVLTLTPRALQRIRGRHVGMVFQEPLTALNPLHTLFDQIAAPILLHRFPVLRKRQMRDYIVSLLEMVGFPEGRDRLKAYPHQLSGGQRQRVMMAIALACQPQMLIADEPTTALDVTVQAELLFTLKEIQRTQQMGLIFISHNLDVVKNLAHTIAVMQKGCIVEMAPKEHIFAASEHPYTRQLLESRPSGKAPVAGDGKQILKADGLSVSVTTHTSLWRKTSTALLQGASFSVAAGETLGIVGESGSGKTTLALALLRLMPAEGQVAFLGKRLLQLKSSEMRRIRPFLQMVFQDPFGSLNPRMSISQIISEGLWVHGRIRTRREEEIAVSRALAEVGLDPGARYRYPHEFSGGQRQRIAIARALVLAPRLVILDEPTSSLDLTVQAEILALLRRLQADKGLAYLFISHDLRVIRTMSHHVMILQRGKVVESGATEAIFDYPREDYTKRLISAAYFL